MDDGSWRISVGLNCQGTTAPGYYVAQPSVSPTCSFQQVLAFGAGSGECNLIVVHERPLGAGLSETLNLYDGTLTDIHGDAAPFRLLKAVCVGIVSGGDTSGVTIGNAATNGHPLFMGGATHTHTLYPSGLPYLGAKPAGIAVTSSAANVKVTNNSAALVTYRIAAAGTTSAGEGYAMGVLGLTYG